MDVWADEVARRAATLRDELRRGVSVGISGVDCSGKSTLAAALARRLGDAGLPEAVVIVEGCFLYAGGRARGFDLSVWLELPLDEIVPRALARPGDLERMGGPDGVRARYAARYVPGQRLHLERDRPAEQATLVLPPASAAGRRARS